ncbi:MAG: alpha/beta fold hydrolase [Gammaproteobacteria bacterium]|jgi:pimeloyl-ACP methyl ester carboxylesterase|nr:alpha/beta fold hydrolase [Gammaproteobacteria bacterium]
MLIERHFATLATAFGTRQLHYRRCGTGPAVLLLHQSPQSSAEYEPLMREWADRFTVIAPDYPGFGMSDPLGADGELELGLDDFAGVLIALLDALGIRAAGAYGFHTGAGMAVALADRAPERISAVYANGYVVLSDAEREATLSGYLPPFRPAWDGAHLLWLWTRNRDQLIFYPWFARRAAARIARTVPPPAVLHDWAMELLRAGDHYRVGYRAAFTYPGEVPVRRLRTPAIITATNNDVLAACLQRITDPAPGVAVRLGGSMADNLAEAAAFFAANPGAEPPSPPPTAPAAKRAWNTTVMTPAGCVRVRCDLTRPGTPILLLHDLGGASETVEPLLTALAVHRPVLTLDLPGHGETHRLNGADFVAACIDAIGAVLDHFAMTRVHAAGCGGGSVVLAAAARARSTRFAGLVLSGLPYLDTAAAREQAERFAPRIDPVWHGGHLLEYWHVARNQALFWPWYAQDDAHALSGEPRAEAADLHVRTLALLKAAADLPAAAAAVFTYPLDGALAELSRPAALAAAPSDPHAPHVRAAAAAHPHHKLIDLPDAPAAQAPVLLEIFAEE